MHGYMCTHTHVGTHTLSFSFCITHTHTHNHALTHFLSLCYAPAVKSQLNNESAALFPLCIEAEELVVACIEQYMCGLFSQLQHGQLAWGKVSRGSENIQARLPILV